jgi:hypothetical protein
MSQLVERDHCLDFGLPSSISSRSSLLSAASMRSNGQCQTFQPADPCSEDRRPALCPEENPSPGRAGLSCCGCFRGNSPLAAYGGCYTQWQIVLVLQICTAYPSPTGNGSRSSGEHLTQPAALRRSSVPIRRFCDSLWFEPSFERVSAGHAQLLLRWRGPHCGPEQNAKENGRENHGGDFAETHWFKRPIDGLHKNSPPIAQRGCCSFSVISALRNAI